MSVVSTDSFSWWVNLFLLHDCLEHKGAKYMPFTHDKRVICQLGPIHALLAGSMHLGPLCSKQLICAIMFQKQLMSSHYKQIQVILLFSHVCNLCMLQRAS